MVFNSLTFILFFFVVILLYYLLPRKFRWVFLLLSSYFFYLYANYKLAFFIIFTTISSYFGALVIDRLNSKENNISKELDIKAKKKIKLKIKKDKRKVLISILIVNFGILIFLKYFNFVSDNLNVFLNSISIGFNSPKFNLILPLGISFYTFQTMSYVIDVYWKKINAERNIAKVALFVSFFPQIIEGPIGRYKELAPQLYSGNSCNYKNLKFGIQLMMWGYFKKLVIADRVAIVADYVFNNYLNISGTGIAVGVFLYAIQDYTDFSGAIDIARGCAKAMGIDMAENFKRPYFSRTIPEFWRRWHISLGAWMKDYVFYPFSLSKGMKKISKLAKKYTNKHIARTLPIALGNIVVFFLVGVWHGASWNYILWGLFYGVLIAISGMMIPIFEYLKKVFKINPDNILFQGFQIARTFWITCIGCIIFRANGIYAAFQIFIKSFDCFHIPSNFSKELLSFGLSKNQYFVLVFSIMILFICDLLQERMCIREIISKRNIILRWSFYIMAFLLIILLGVYGPGYNQNSFVYMQF